MKDKYRARIPKSCHNCGAQISGKYGRGSSAGGASDMDNFDFEEMGLTNIGQPGRQQQ